MINVRLRANTADFTVGARIEMMISIAPSSPAKSNAIATVTARILGSTDCEPMRALTIELRTVVETMISAAYEIPASHLPTTISMLLSGVTSRVSSVPRSFSPANASAIV